MTTNKRNARGPVAGNFRQLRQLRPLRQLECCNINELRQLPVAGAATATTDILDNEIIGVRAVVQLPHQALHRRRERTRYAVRSVKDGGRSRARCIPPCRQHGGLDDRHTQRRAFSRLLETTSDGRWSEIRDGANRTVPAEGRPDDDAHRLAVMVRRDRPSLRTHDAAEEEVDQPPLPGASRSRAGGPAADRKRQQNLLMRRGGKQQRAKATKL